MASPITTDALRRGRRVPVLAFFIIGSIAPSGVAPLSSSTVDADKIELLVQRIDAYRTLFKEREYDRAYEMLNKWWTEKPEDRKEWNRATRKMDNGIRITDWRVKEIRVAGGRAKVLMRISGQTREGLFRWKDFTEQQTDFWAFEKGNWYFIPLQIRNWDDSQALEVPVPKPPLKVTIREKE